MKSLCRLDYGIEILTFFVDSILPYKVEVFYIFFQALLKNIAVEILVINGNKLKKATFKTQVLKIYRRWHVPDPSVCRNLTPLLIVFFTSSDEFLI